MSGGEYVPSTNDVREDFAFPWEEHHKGDGPERKAAFDRWLAARDAEQQAVGAERELRRMADAIEVSNAGIPGMAIGDAVRGVRRRANRIAAEREGDGNE